MFQEEPLTNIKIAENSAHINGMKAFYRRTGRLSAAIALPLLFICLLFCALIGPGTISQSRAGYNSLHTSMNRLLESNTDIAEIRSLTPGTYAVYLDSQAWEEYTQTERESCCQKIISVLENSASREIDVWFYNEEGSLLASY